MQEHPLKTLRRAKGLTLTEVSDLTGVEKGALSRIERYERFPGTPVLMKIAVGLGLDELADELWGWVWKNKPRTTHHR